MWIAGSARVTSTGTNGLLTHAAFLHMFNRLQLAYEGEVIHSFIYLHGSGSPVIVLPLTLGLHLPLELLNLIIALLVRPRSAVLADVHVLDTAYVFDDRQSR